MDTQGSPESEERSFLHDMCNGLAVVQGSMHLVIMKSKKIPSAITLEEAAQRLEKALASVEKMNKMIAERRDRLIAKLSE